MNTLRTKLGHVPAPLGGLALGIASLGWSLENLGDFGGTLQLTGALIAGILLVLLLGKVIFASNAISEDLKHPVVGSVMPTTAMALVTVSNAVSQYNFGAGEALWLIGVGLHLVFLASFTYHRARDFNLHHMVPSWFVPPIGIVAAAVAFPGGPFEGFAHVLLWVGLIAYAVMLPMMLYRLIFHPEVPDAFKPTIAILAAPASLSLAGYLTLMANPSPLVVAVLGGIAVAMTALIYLSFLHLLRMPFCLGFSAFTFPLVIGATALFKTVTWMESLGASANLVEQVRVLADLELFVATAVVLYVSCRYMLHFALVLLPARAAEQQVN